MEQIRKFALVVIDDFDTELDRFNIAHAESPKNLGFELQFTTLETYMQTRFTSVKEKKNPTTLNIVFLPPYAYTQANLFKQFVQRYIKYNMAFEYDDTTGNLKYWEGKIQRFGQEELTDWGGLVCPISFMPSSPKYLKQNNIIRIQPPTVGKSYPFQYSYSYGKSAIQNNLIDNTYFEDIPLRVTIYGKMSNPQIGLSTTTDDKELYSSVQFNNLTIDEDEHLVIDAIRSKVLLWRGGKYISAYDYVSKRSDLDTFLYAKSNTASKVYIRLNTGETGYLVASYRQYIL